MAVRGKVKVIRSSGGSISGRVTDTASREEFDFEQPYGSELGLAENMIVRMEIITKSDGTKLAVSLDPVEKGRILTLDAATNSGTLRDNVGNEINFVQDYITELGLAVGDRVSYATVTPAGTIGDGGTSDSGGTAGGGTPLGGGTSTLTATIATCLQKVGN